MRELAAEIDGRTEADFGPLADQKTPEDRAAWLELYSDRLFESEEFAKLSLDIRDDIENRFEFIEPETLVRSATGWPVVWTFETPGTGRSSCGRYGGSRATITENSVDC